MKTVRWALVVLLAVKGFMAHAQDKRMSREPSEDTRLIAVVNRADWCKVCAVNGQRFTHLLSSYAAQGVTIYMNDLTNDTTRETSKTTLQEAGIYEAVMTTPRKGMSRMLKSCGLAKDRKAAAVASGIVTFIDPHTHRQLKQLSIAEPDEEMKVTIDHLLTKPS